MPAPFSLTVGLRPQLLTPECNRCHKPLRVINGKVFEARCCTYDPCFDWSDLFFILTFFPEHWPQLRSRGRFDAAAFSLSVERGLFIPNPGRRSHPCLLWTPEGCSLPYPARTFKCRTFVCRRIRKRWPKPVEAANARIADNRAFLDATSVGARARELSQEGTDPVSVVQKLRKEYMEYVLKLDRAAAALGAGYHRYVDVAAERWYDRARALHPPASSETPVRLPLQPRQRPAAPAPAGGSPDLSFSAAGARLPGAVRVKATLGP